VVELPRLRLPLPERTGSDRDELLSPHGFVDRAYSVFLLRCVSLLRTDSLHLPGYGRCVHPPFVLLQPRCRIALACASASGSERGYEPLGASAPTATSTAVRRALPGTSCGELPRWWSGGSRADGGARPARVPSERLGSQSPLRDPQPPGLATRVASQPVSAAQVKQGACQSWSARPPFLALVTSSYCGNGLAPSQT
jgi:hypothetical protein